MAKNANIMGKMTARDITKNLMQYLSMIIITCLAVTLFCGFISNALTLEAHLNDYYTKTNLTDLIVQYSEIGENDKEFLESLPGEVEYRIYTEGSVGSRNAKVFVAEKNNSISLPLITSGIRGVLIDKSLHEKDRINIGDALYVEIQLPFEELSRLKLTLFVTGIMTMPETAAAHSSSPVYIDAPKFVDALFTALPAEQLRGLVLKYAEEGLIDISFFGINIEWLLNSVSDEWLKNTLLGISNEQKLRVFERFCTQALIKTTNPDVIKDRINNYYKNTTSAVGGSVHATQSAEQGSVFNSGQDVVDNAYNKDIYNKEKDIDNSGEEIVEEFIVKTEDVLLQTVGQTVEQSTEQSLEQSFSNFIFVLDRDSMESLVMLDTEISQSLKMIYVFPVIFMLVSVLVILSTIGPLILKERTNIGTLKSIGISDGRILAHYALFGVILCFIGGVIGAIAGPLIIPRVLLIKYGLVYNIPTFERIVFSPFWSAAAILFVCALAGLIGFWICRKTTREKPAECMRPLPPKTGILFWLGRKGRTKDANTDMGTYAASGMDKAENNANKYASGSNSLLNCAICENENKDYERNNGIICGEAVETKHKARANGGRGISLKMAVRNIIIKPSRAFMTIVGVAGCVALLVCSFGIGDTVNNSVNFELGNQFKYDISTSYAADAEQKLFDVLDKLADNGKVDYYECYKIYYMSAKGDNIKDIKVFALPESPRLTTISPGGKILITKSVAEDLGVGAGDTIILSVSGSSYEILIDEIIENSFTKGIFVTDMGEFEGVYHTLDMWIAATNSADSELIAKQVNNVNGTKSAFTMQGQRKSVDNMISSIQTIRLTMMVFSIALAVVVLYNLSLLNIKERHRDLATLKVLGFSTGAISRSLLFEIMILVLLGTGAGLLVGYPVTVLVMAINRIEVLTFLYKIEPISYVLSALLALGTSLVINLLFARPIAKINMTESLKSVE